MPDFKFGYIMIDKSKQEMAAVRQLQLTGDATDFLLCYFHFLQEWERFLRSSESGVSERGMQHRILVELAALAHVQEQSLFKQKVRGAAVSSQRRPNAAACSARSIAEPSPCQPHPCSSTTSMSCALRSLPWWAT